MKMTPTGYMTEECWDDMAEEVAKGIRAMPVIKDHSDWWVRLVLDGFGSHFSDEVNTHPACQPHETNPWFSCKPHG